MGRKRDSTRRERTGGQRAGGQVLAVLVVWEPLELSLSWRMAIALRNKGVSGTRSA